MKRTKREKKRKNEKKVNGGEEGVENKGIIDKGQATISRVDPHKFLKKIKTRNGIFIQRKGSKKLKIFFSWESNSRDRKR